MAILLINHAVIVGDSVLTVKVSVPVWEGDVVAAAITVRLELGGGAEVLTELSTT